MESSETSPRTQPSPPRARVWQDTAAESLLIVAVGVIGLTGNDSFVLRLNFWLASVIPAYDPMATMLALIIMVVSPLISGSIGVKASARGASEASLQRARSRRAQPRRT